MTLALALVVITLSISYIVMDKRLEAIDTSVNNITDISSHAIGILRINKDIVEMQRDISVYGASGSDAVFAKIEENYQSIDQRLKAIDKKNSVYFLYFCVYRESKCFWHGLEFVLLSFTLTVESFAGRKFHGDKILRTPRAKIKFSRC